MKYDMMESDLISKVKLSFLYFADLILRNFNGFSLYKSSFLPHYINTDIFKVSLSMFVHFQNFLIVFVISFFTFVSLNVDLGQTLRLLGIRNKLYFPDSKTKILAIFLLYNMFHLSS